MRRQAFLLAVAAVVTAAVVPARCHLGNVGGNGGNNASSSGSGAGGNPPTATAGTVGGAAVVAATVSASMAVPVVLAPNGTARTALAAAAAAAARITPTAVPAVLRPYTAAAAVAPACFTPATVAVPVLPALSSSHIHHLPASQSPLTGVSATGAVGSLGVQRTAALSGVAGAGAVGSVAPGWRLRSLVLPALRRLALWRLARRCRCLALRARAPWAAWRRRWRWRFTGVEGIAAVGSVGIGGNITVALTGVSATGEVGDVTASGNVLIDTHDGMMRRSRRERRIEAMRAKAGPNAWPTRRVAAGAGSRARHGGGDCRGNHRTGG